jgi:cell division protein FtsI/penicillin-binding protein 2
MFRPFQYWRLLAIVLVVLAGLGWVAGRLFEIQITRHRQFLGQARRFSETVRVLEARRGQIRDRNGETVAISAPVKTLYLNAALCSNRVDQVGVSRL